MTKCDTCGNELHCAACEIGDEDKRFAGVVQSDLGNVVVREPATPEERHHIVIETI